MTETTTPLPGDAPLFETPESLLELTPGTMPQALTERRQWCIWRLVPDADGKPRKVPFQADHPDNPKAYASSTNPDTWSDYETARRCVEAGKAHGTGFVFADDDSLVFVDLDDVIDDHGVIDPARRWIVDAMPTHWHLSQSGRGLHAVAYGAIPASVHNKAAGVEMYASGRYMAIPADLQLLTDVTEPTECGPVLEAMYERYRLDKVEPGKERAADPVRLTMAAANVIERLQERPNMAALLSGDAFGYDGWSEARYALANGALFYTDDVADLTAIIRSSGLYKPGTPDHDKDRRAAYDAKRALQGYTGARYDPAYGQTQTSSTVIGPDGTIYRAGGTADNAKQADKAPQDARSASEPENMDTDTPESAERVTGDSTPPNGSKTEPQGEPVGMLRPAGSDSVMEPVAADILQRRDFYLDTGHSIRGHSTGFPALDDMLGGLEPGRVTLFQAEPAAGKTLISNQIAYTLAAAGVPVLYLTFENEPADLIRKHVARIADKSPRLLDRGTLDIGSEGIGAALDTFQETAQTLYYLDGNQNTDKETVRGAVAYLNSMYPDRRPVVFVDYLQMYGRVLSGPREDLFAVIGRVSRELTDLAKQHRVHVWAITSLNREAYKGGTGKNPGMAGGKGSGDLEYDAAAVITLVKRDAASAPSSHVEVLDMHVVKNRYGPGGPITLHRHTRSLAVSEPETGSITNGAVRPGETLTSAIRRG